MLEAFPARINDRPFPFRGRDDLEVGYLFPTQLQKLGLTPELQTLLCSDSSEDWVKITSMFLGPPPDSWSFTPKHKVCGLYLHSHRAKADSNFS